MIHDSIPATARVSALLQNVQTGCATTPASYSVDTRGLKWPGFQVNTHLHLMLRLGTSEAIPILPLCACLAWLYFTKLTGRQMGLDFSSVG